MSKPQLEMRYSTTTNVPTYLRVEDDTQFLEGNWFPQTGINGPTSNTWNDVPFDGGLLHRDTDPADGGIGASQQQVQATIVMQKGATGQQSLVPFVGDPYAVNLPGTAFGAVKPTAPTLLLSVDDVQLDQDIVNGTTVISTSLVSAATAAQLERAGTNYPSWTSPYTDAKDDGNGSIATIERLAKEWTAGLTDPYDQATAIQNHLRNPAFFQYTLTPPAVPRASIWPVVYFLTVSHRGYCQYFASAMGTMLRTLGIPTRLVSGYGPGTTRAESGRQGLREQQVSTSDAHSWVEAYFPGYGWIPFEPTPPSAQGDYQPLPRGSQAVSGVPLPTTAPVVRGTPTPAHGFGGNDPTATKITPSKPGIPAAVIGALAVLGGALVLVIAAILWLALPRSLKGAWRRVETLGVMSGMDRRRSETHSAYAARLAKARPRAGDALSELASVTARAEFSAEGASEHERAAALHTWRRALFAARPRLGRSPG